jgi:23S rRNA pseudouridine1911/1915/1917 synthase
MRLHGGAWRGMKVGVDSEEFVVDEAGGGGRLDRFLVGRLAGVSRARVQAAIRAGGVRWNGGMARASVILRPGDRVSWKPPEAEAPAVALPEDIPLRILHEDEALVVIDKPAGMVVHPGAGNTSGTVVSALLYHCGGLPAIGGVLRPGIVHRLDRETSGCLVVAKTPACHTALGALFASRAVSKTYLALVQGTPRRASGTISLPIARHPVHRKKMAVCEPGCGRSAATGYRVLWQGDRCALLECKPETGRTHQIRVHLKHLGHPVLGDPLYGHRGSLPRHMLHAWKLAFRHPVSGQTLRVEAPVPEEFTLRMGGNFPLCLQG